VPPRPNPEITDKIAAVDWDGPAPVTMVLPEHPEPAANCRSGDVDLIVGEVSGPYPIVMLASPAGADYPVFGDLTGDGRPEAVVWAQCLFDPQDSGDGAGQLLVVSRQDDGALRALAWVGPRGALYPTFWVANGTLFADARPWHNDWGYGMGDVLAYRWNGDRFVTVDSGYRGIQAFPGRPATSIDLRAVAGLLACPGPAGLSLAAASPPDPAPTEVVVDGYRYDFASPVYPDGLPHWVDLAGDGDLFLLVPLVCRRDGSDAVLSQGVLVLAPSGDVARAVDFVPLGTEYNLGGWTSDRGRLEVDAYRADGTQVDDPAHDWVWNGRYFQPQ
jgi:hypothetical protein